MEYCFVSILLSNIINALLSHIKIILFHIYIKVFSKMDVLLILNNQIFMFKAKLILFSQIYFQIILKYIIANFLSCIQLKHAKHNYEY